MTTLATRVFVIGAGKAGRALTHAMRIGGVDVVGLHGRQSSHGITSGALPATLALATVVLVTVRDAELDGVLRDVRSGQSGVRAGCWCSMVIPVWVSRR